MTSERAAANSPIGVFDSGVGGLTILRELLRELPDERYVYFGDTGNCPYGVRAEEEIQTLSVAAANFLLERGAKIIVVACNTASVSALATLRATFTTPFVGVVPAVKPAAELTKVKRVGVASTEASAKGGYLQRLIHDHANGVEVLPVGCPLLVTLAEEGKLDGAEVEETVRGYIQPLLDRGIDILVLGCTHFPAMRPVFERVAGPEVAVIDSGAAIARQTRRVLTERGWLASKGPAQETPRSLSSDDEFWHSGDQQQFERVASVLMGAPIAARRAPVAVMAPVRP
ncbi:MAG TPA: glutamate racemase [Ktedonobacterales bacterium]|jgi:glutamate racemase